MMSEVFTCSATQRLSSEFFSNLDDQSGAKYIGNSDQYLEFDPYNTLLRTTLADGNSHV